MGISIDEKRVFDDSEDSTPVYVAGEFGVARVDTADDRVGEFGLARRCSARDIAERAGRLAVATDGDVLVGVAGDEGGEAFEALGVGPAVAVGFEGSDREDGRLLVAREDGSVAREDGSIIRSNGSEWTELGELAAVRAIDGDLLAAESGVYKTTADDLRRVGLEDVRDVSTAGTPLAATGDGLYRLGNGWMDELTGDFRAVSAAPGDASTDASADATANTGASAGTFGWAHAASEDGLFAHEGGEWCEVALPIEDEVVAVDHGAEDGAYAVTADGTFLVSVGDGWNHQVLGLRGAKAVAAP